MSRFVVYKRYLLLCLHLEVAPHFVRSWPVVVQKPKLDGPINNSHLGLLRCRKLIFGPLPVVVPLSIKRNVKIPLSNF